MHVMAPGGMLAKSACPHRQSRRPKAGSSSTTACRKRPPGALDRVGLALLDLDDPRRVLHRGDEWVVGPRERYEVTGDIPNVVFPCGALTCDGELRLYYGAADTCIGLLPARIADVLDWLRSQTST